MKSSYRLLSGLLLAIGLLATPVFSADTKKSDFKRNDTKKSDTKKSDAKSDPKKGKSADAAKHQFSEWKLGALLFGEESGTSNLTGKVVALEYWGVNCPPCIASLPHLAELDKKFRKKGLCVIGAESQNSSKEQIKPLIERAKVEYPIVGGTSGPIPVSGIPRAFVFDKDGDLVFDGHPADDGFEKAITKALKGATPPAAAATTTTSSTTPEPGKSGLLIPSRAWTNSDGVEIRAAVKKADETTVTFQMPDGRALAYPMEKLSESSREAIAEANKAAK